MSRRRLTLRSSRDERGASALELAFLAPAFLLLIFLTIQGALYFYGRNVAIQAAREGVSQLRLAQDEATYRAQRDGIVARTTSFADTVGRGGLNNAEATPQYDGDQRRVAMTVSGTAITLVPGLRLKVRQSAYGNVEVFRADENP